VRWFRRYFNYPKFPAAAKATLAKALRAEVLTLALLGLVIWRLVYLHDITYKVGGKYIDLSGGAGYNTTSNAVAAAPPSWENFLVGDFATRLGLTGPQLEIEIVWALLAAVLVAFGAFVLVLDWRKPREEHYRPTLYLLTFFNLAVALGGVSLAASKVAPIVAIGAQVLIVVMFVLKPAPRAGWKTRV
jgi:hypothetical protein